MLFNLNIVTFTHYSLFSIIILDHEIISHPVYNGLNKSYIHSQFFQFHIYILDRVVIANCKPDHITPIHLSPSYKKYWFSMSLKDLGLLPYSYLSSCFPLFFTFQSHRPFGTYSNVFCSKCQSIRLHIISMPELCPTFL